MVTPARSRPRFPCWLPALAIVVCLPLVARAQAGAGAVNLPAATAAIDRFVAVEFAKDTTGSLTVGVVTKDGLAWTRSYGVADAARGVPATRDTVYRIGSITKQFTAVMLLQLVEQGKVHLSDPVEKYLPEIKKVKGRRPGAPPITLVQLATMTAGLAREPEDLPTFTKGPVSQWEKTLVAALERTTYQFEPGTRYFYSNIGYAALGAALGRAAGEPYVDYVTKRILEPLGMTHSAFDLTPAVAAHLAKGYQWTKGTVDAATPAREHQGRGYKVPNGALYTTVGDLARFVAFELGGGPESVLAEATRDDTYSRANSASGDLATGYGIGFQLARRGMRVVYGHGGSVSGYTAAAHFDRALGHGVIVLRNAGGGPVNVGTIAMRMLDLLAASGQKSSAAPGRRRGGGARTPAAGPPSPDE